MVGEVRSSGDVETCCLVSGGDEESEESHRASGEARAGLRAGLGPEAIKPLLWQPHCIQHQP